MRNHLFKVLRGLAAPAIVIGLISVAAPAQNPEHLCFLTVARLAESGHSERRNYVINDRAAWEELWTKVGSAVSPNLPIPDIDFTRRTVIAVFEGSEPMSGFEVVIIEISKVEDSLKVIVRETINTHCGGTGSITRPFHIVEIEKQEHPEVEFKFKQKEKKCP